MQIQLRWVEPASGQEKEPRLETPVIFGNDIDAMPSSLDGKAASRMVLSHDQVAPFHAVLTEVDGRLYVSDRNSRSGLQVNGITQTTCELKAGDVLQIGPFDILVSLISPSNRTCNNQVGFLIKRRCGRSTSEGCKFCRNGQAEPDLELYSDDYELYPDYGNYDDSSWGSDYYRNRDRYYYDNANRRVDFTEADGASFEQESEQDYEMDLDAS